MNENIDLTNILKNCPKGWKFWSPLFGEVKFDHIVFNRIEIECVGLHRIVEFDLTGKYIIEISENNGVYFSSECLLFPSKDQRDWSKFTAPWYKKDKRFDPNTLQPFDKVLVRDECYDRWKCEFYSHMHDDNGGYPYIVINEGYKHCIPYNDDTKHLVGTDKEAPEYYRYWED